MKQYQNFVRLCNEHRFECRKHIETLFFEESTLPIRDGPELPKMVDFRNKIAIPVLQRMIAITLNEDPADVIFKEDEQDFEKENYRVRRPEGSKQLTGLPQPFTFAHKVFKRLILEVRKELCDEGLIIEDEKRKDSLYYTSKGIEKYSQYEPKFPLSHLDKNLLKEIDELFKMCGQYKEGTKGYENIFDRHRRVLHNVFIEIVKVPFTKLGLTIPSVPRDPVSVPQVAEFLKQAKNEIENKKRKEKATIRGRLAGDGSDFEAYRSILKGVDEHDLLTELEGVILLGERDISTGITGSLVHTRDVRNTGKCIEHIRDRASYLKDLFLRVDEMVSNISE